MSLMILALAVALMLIVEGFLPFLKPALWRKALQHLAQLSDGQIRFLGLSSIMIGLIVFSILTTLRS
ncbi:MAG: DUF2065 domain-containing protein [Zoogloeaceae bacterium]|jgi:uncharacterized protein YjeT (DUF2065 family)|nr:DUF2065 domain-containing protein [Zoogloeaceae bacterium]